MPEPHTIVITMTTRPNPAQYANAVLGCQTVLALAGLGDIATVQPDPTLATDDQLCALADHWADTNPWS